MLAVFAERQGARGVPAVGRQIEDVLGISCAFGGLLVVVEADYFAGVADVDVIIVKGNAKRAFEISGKNLAQRSAAGVLRVAEDDHFAGAGVRGEDVAIWRGGEKAHVLELLSEYVHLETRRNLWKKSVRPLHS